MIAFFKLIRWQNLAFIIFFYLIARYGFLNYQSINLAMNHWQYGLFILAIVCIAAAGYIINDIMDYPADLINKPKKVIVNHAISEKNAYNLLVTLNLVGVGIGYYLSSAVEQTNVFILFILLVSILYFYSTNFKRIAFLGNLIIAFVMFVSVLMVGILDLYPQLKYYDFRVLKIFFDVLLDYAWFIFFITLLREIIKDAQDLKGDEEAGYKTLPLLLGIKTTNLILIVLTFGIIGYLFYYINTFLIKYDLYFASIYLLTTVAGPLIWLGINLYKAQNASDYKKMSLVIKIIMFFGMLSLLVTQMDISTF